MSNVLSRRRYEIGLIFETGDGLAGEGITFDTVGLPISFDLLNDSLSADILEEFWWLLVNVSPNIRVALLFAFDMGGSGACINGGGVI
jgi:hypothetical protein